MSEQQSEEAEQRVVAKGPGDILQAARIEQGISIDDIARQMNLNARILKSIEDDDYSDVQSPIFIRGYLRTYARLVGVDEDNTIKTFSEFYQKDDPAIKSTSNTIPEISSNDFRVKWMTYVVIIGLLGLLSVWWVNNYKPLETADNSNTKDLIEINKVDEQTTENNTIDHSNGLVDASPNENLQIMDQQNVVVSNIDEPIDDEQTVQEESIINVDDAIEKLVSIEEESIDTSETTSVNAAITEEVVALKQDTSNADDSLQASPPLSDQQLTKENIKKYTRENSAPKGDDVLEINVVATSWGEIKDASNFKLLQDLMNAGNTYRLVGKKPFKIFLGNGYGVELTLNGHSIDFTKHIKSSNNTARFELEK